jgi:serine/threonine protein kinase
MGEVYRARDIRLGRDVAPKTLPETFVRDPERMARFKREAQVLAAFNHPNIAQRSSDTRDGIGGKSDASWVAQRFNSLRSKLSYKNLERVEASTSEAESQRDTETKSSDGVIRFRRYSGRIEPLLEICSNGGPI